LPRIHHPVAVVFIIGCSLATGSVHAADTVETWDAGAIDIDAYIGVDGLGLPRGERTLFGDLMLGYGVVRHLSVYAGTVHFTNDGVRSHEDEYYFGLFGTPVDEPCLDLDLFLGWRVAGKEALEVQITPGLEINADHHPERESFGVYLRTESPLSREHVVVEATPGAYSTVAGGHMLFAEYHLTWRSSGVRHPLQHGGGAIGYNVTLGSAYEMVNEAHVDVPGDDEPISYGFSTGVIVTIP
jgi:hypothetical protein